MLDLRLLHHYTAHTSTTLDSTMGHLQSHIWQDSVVRLAFGRHNAFLLRCLLAVAGRHLALDPRESYYDRSRTWPVRAAAHFDAAMSSFRRVLEQNSDNEDSSQKDQPDPEAIFIFSCILVIHNFADKNIEPKKSSVAAGELLPDELEDRHFDDPIEALVTSFRLVRGVSEILRPHYTRIMASEVAAIVGNATTNESEEQVPELLHLREWVVGLEASKQSSESSRGSDILAEAVTKLNQSFANLPEYRRNRSLLAAMFRWPVIISEHALHSLERREPLALVILAHFTILLKSGRRCWWLAGWDKAILRSIETELADKPDHYQWLTWPRNEIHSAVIHW